ncbi:MAG: hypothetical protein ACOVOW_05250 [Spirosomataceae bacterium]|jgi:predicted nucleic acid-binding protein
MTTLQLNFTLVTGDKDLLEHNPFKKAQIINPSDFEGFLTSIHP